MPPSTCMMFFSMLLCGLMMSVAVSGEVVHNRQVNGITFEEVQPDLVQVSNAGLGVTYLEEDQFLPNHILYTDNNSVKTLNTKTLEQQNIVGDDSTRGYLEGNGSAARFHGPTSFYQTNVSHFTLLDSNNHCVRIVSRLTNQTARLAGICTVRGNVVGTFTASRFNLPEKVIRLPSGNLAIAEVGNRCIKVLDLDDETTSILVTLTRLIYSLTMRPDTNMLYFSTTGGLGMVNLESKNVTYITRLGSVGVLDGTLAEAVFDSRPESLLFLTADVLLVTGLHSHILRVVNLKDSYVSSICDPSDIGASTQAGGVENCKLTSPRSLLLLSNETRLIIGFSSSIGYMKISGLVKPQSTTRSIASTNLPANPPTTSQSTINPGHGPVETSVREHDPTVLSIGIIVGGVAFISLVVAGVLCFRKAYHRSNREPQQPMVTGLSEPGTSSDNVYDYIDNYGYSTENTANLNIAYEQPRKTSLPCNSSMPTFQAPGSPMQEEEPRYYFKSPSQRPDHHADGRSKNNSNFSLPRQNFSIA